MTESPPESLPESSHTCVHRTGLSIDRDPCPVCGIPCPDSGECYRTRKLFDSTLLPLSRISTS